MRNNKNGFTLVELIIVIVIIAILASIALFSYTKVQENARDSDRDSKVKIISNALEKYYEQNGEYPSCSAMTQSGSQVATDVLPKFDPTNLLTPKSQAGSTNSITCTDLSSDGSGSDSFGYVGDGSATCKTGNACTKYTLQYRDEDTGDIVSLNSQHQSQVGIAGSTTLTATTTSTTQINLSWAAVASASGYTIQRATDSGFSADLVTTPTGGTSKSVTGLTPGRTYFFRVAPTSTVNAGDWSNTANTTTSISAPPTPSTSATMSGTTAIGTANPVACASGTPQYQLRYRAQSNAGALGGWSAWSAWSATKRTYSVGAAQGYDYDFQSHANCQGPNLASATTADSNVASAVMGIYTPAAPTYLSPGMFVSQVWATVNYATYCPGGTWVVSPWWRSHDWLGNYWGNYTFPGADRWENTDHKYEPVQYWGSYACASSYTTSPRSPESYNVVQVQDPRYP